MSKTVFVDLRIRELSCYVFERNGRSGTPKEIFTSPVGEGYSFAIEQPFERPDESYLSLPLSLLDFRILDLPFSDIRKIRELIPFEIDNLVLGGSRSVVFDAHIISRSDGRSQVLVAYVPKETLRAILERLRGAGIDPRAVISVELAAVVASSATAEEIATRLLAPAPIGDETRMEGAYKEIADPTINLRRDEFAYTVDDERTKRSLRMTAVLIFLLLLVFASDSIMGIISSKRQSSSIKEAMRKTYQGLFPAEKKISNELYQLRAHMKELKDKEDSFIGVSPLGILLDLSKVSRPGVVFTEVSVDRENIVLKGECASLSDVQKTKTELEKFLAQVNISDTKPSSQNKTSFTITAKERKT
jgi:type II secretory pathway component PulL